MTNAVTTEDVNVVDMVDGMGRDGRRAQFACSSPDPLVQFGLETNPFADNVNPSFFFRTESHEETFILMKRAVADCASLALCTALSGTGKTLLTQILLQELNPEKTKAILVLVYPGMSRTALLREIISELEIAEPPARTSIHSLLSIIQQEIIRFHRQGQRLVLIIDEVHFLKTDSLHILRTLSNIEVPQRKLISVLLFGEESLRERLNHPSYRALLSRMVVRCTIHPLTEHEVEQYVKFRMLMAGGDQSLFADDAFAPIAKVTGGVPREVNRIAHNALLAAARRGLKRIDGELIRSLAERHAV